MKGSVIPFGTKSATAVGTGAAAAVVVTLGTTGLEQGGQHVIDWINPSSDLSSSVVGTLTIAAGGVTLYSTHIRTISSTQSSPLINFGYGLECGVGREVVITLGAMTGITGELNVGYR